MAYLMPEPPHISVGFYTTAFTEREVFTRTCRVALKSISAKHGFVDVAPANVPFDAVSDLAGQLSSIECTPIGAFGDIVDGHPVRARWSSRQWGHVVVMYERAADSPRHPVAVIMSAGVLGTPVDLWRKRDKSMAMRLGRLIRAIGMGICESVHPWYIQVAVERTTPPPAALIHDPSCLDGEIYVSSRLIGDAVSLVDDIRAEFGEHAAVAWPGGYYFSGWAPLAEHGIPDESARLLSSRVAGYLARRLGDGQAVMA